MTTKEKNEGFFLKGIAIANGFALVCLVLTTYLLKYLTGYSGLFVLAEFVILPMAIGLINAYIWRSHRVSIGDSFIYGGFNLIISLIFSAFVMREGVICLIIVAPLLYVFIMAGIFLGELIFHRNNSKLNMSLIAALTSAFLLNVITASPSSNYVTDKVIIQATPEEVWKNVVSFSPIEEEPSYWLFKLGLPNPVQSTAEGDFVGANRQCIFSNGAIFEEVISELEPNEKLTFDITKQPNDPEIIGHLNLLKGQFVLQDNGDGTTTLIGTSWYDLKIKPSQYFDIWTKSIVRNVHLRVMDHIKELSESAV